VRRARESGCAIVIHNAGSREEGTHSRVEHCPADLGEDSDIYRQRSAESKRDVQKFADFLHRVEIWGHFAVDGGGCDCDLSARESEEQEHESSNELSKEDCDFFAGFRAGLIDTIGGDVCGGGWGGEREDRVVGLFGLIHSESLDVF
jgi:hypothetical protein